MKIKPVTFQYNQRSGYDTTVTQVGVIAQELMEVAPYMVDTFSLQNDDETYYTVNGSAMTSMLINTVQEQQQQTEIAELKTQVAKVNQLEAMLKQLKNNSNISTLTY